jgi:hypothetical protein
MSEIVEESPQFKPGHKRGGRPKGPGSTKGQRLLQRIADAASPSLQRIMAAVAAQAESGDLAAAKIIMDRLWPTPKGRPIKINLPTGGGIAEIEKAFTEIMERLNSGDLTVDEAAGLASLLRMRADLHEAKVIEGRLAALESVDAE